MFGVRSTQILVEIYNRVTTKHSDYLSSWDLNAGQAWLSGIFVLSVQFVFKLWDVSSLIWSVSMPFAFYCT